MIECFHLKYSKNVRCHLWKVCAFVTMRRCWKNEAPIQIFWKNQVHLRLTLLLLDLGNIFKVLWTKKGRKGNMSSCFIRDDIMNIISLFEEKKKKAKHILADVFYIINLKVKDTSVVLLIFNCVLSLLSLLFTSLSVHNRKLPAPLTFWSSSLVQGPFTSSGLSTFCQRCWHWPSVLPWNTATQRRTHHTPTPAHLPVSPSPLHVQLSGPLNAN